MIFLRRVHEIQMAMKLEVKECSISLMLLILSQRHDMDHLLVV